MEFDPENPRCPVCNGPMWDNRQGKKSPKSPDFGCKNKECRWTLDKETNEWVAGNFPTGVWLPKGQKVVKPKPVVNEAQFTQALKDDVKNDDIRWLACMKCASIALQHTFTQDHSVEYVTGAVIEATRILFNERNYKEVTPTKFA
jgi:hypothetical protein